MQSRLANRGQRLIDATCLQSFQYGSDVALLNLVDECGSIDLCVVVLGTTAKQGPQGNQGTGASKATGWRPCLQLHIALHSITHRSSEAEPRSRAQAPAHGCSCHSDTEEEPHRLPTPTRCGSPCRKTTAQQAQQTALHAAIPSQ